MENQTNELTELYDLCDKNPQSYKHHTNLIIALKKFPEKKDEIRELRVRFSQNCALSSKSWREWILDEIQRRDMDDLDNNVRNHIISLCELALSDFQDVGIWVTYLQIAAEVNDDAKEDDDDSDSDSDSDDDDDEDIEDKRALFEESLRAFGVHFSQGSKLWKLYLHYELKQFRNLVKMSSNHNIIEMANHVIKLYQRQLSLPLKDSHITLLNAQKFINKLLSQIELKTIQQDQEKQKQKKILNDIIIQNEKIFNSTKALKLKCQAYEVAIATTMNNIKQQKISTNSHNFDNDSNDKIILLKWIDYINCLIDLKEISLVICCYERAIVQLSFNIQIWESYIKFISEVLKDEQLLFKILKRSIRNIPNCSKFHCQFLQKLEKKHDHHYQEKLQHDKNIIKDENDDELKQLLQSQQSEFVEVVQYALTCPLGDIECFYDVILTYCDYCRRKVSFVWKLTSNIQMIVICIMNLRSCFQNGISWIEQYNNNNNDNDESSDNNESSDDKKKKSNLFKINEKYKIINYQMKLYHYYLHIEENLIYEILNDNVVTYQTIESIFELMINSDIGKYNANCWILYTNYISRMYRRVNNDNDNGILERSIYKKGFDKLCNHIEYYEKEHEDDVVIDNTLTNRIKSKLYIEFLTLCDGWIQMERENGTIISYEETNHIIYETKLHLLKNHKLLDDKSYENDLFFQTEEKNGKSGSTDKSSTTISDMKKSKRKQQLEPEYEKEEKEEDRGEKSDLVSNHKKLKTIENQTSSHDKPMMTFHKNDEQKNILQQKEEDSKKHEDSSDIDIKDPMVAKSLFMSNLSFQATKNDILQILIDYQIIVPDDDINNNEKINENNDVIDDIVLHLNKVNRFRGMATIIFKNNEICDKVFKQLGEHFMYQSRMISLSYSTKQRIGNKKPTIDENKMIDNVNDDEIKNKKLIPIHPETIYVKNINLSLCHNDQTLFNMFSQYGHIVNARLLIDRNTKKMKNEGLVQFQTIEAVQTVFNDISKLTSLYPSICIEKSRFPAVLPIKKNKKPSTSSLSSSSLNESTGVDGHYSNASATIPSNKRNKNNPYLATAPLMRKKKSTKLETTTPITATDSSSLSSQATPKKQTSVFSFVPRTLRK